MPQIIVTTDTPDGATREVHREQVKPEEVVETEAAGHSLVQRIGWALSEADEIESPTATGENAGHDRTRTA